MTDLAADIGVWLVVALILGVIGWALRREGKLDAFMITCGIGVVIFMIFAR